MKGFELMAALSTHFAEHGNAGRDIVFKTDDGDHVPVGIERTDDHIAVHLEAVVDPHDCVRDGHDTSIIYVDENPVAIACERCPARWAVTAV